MHRVESLMNQVGSSSAPQSGASVMTNSTSNSMNLGKIGSRSDDDIVIVSARRTAITKARRGGFKDTPVEELLAAPIKAVIEESGIDSKLIGDVIVGSVLGSNVQRANECRMACFMAGLPDTVPVHLINRQCSSGIQAVAHVAANIKAGFYEVGLAAGVESMSTASMNFEGKHNPNVFMNQQAKDCLIPMGITSENVAKQYKVSRVEQDTLAAASNQKAVAAIRKGNFKTEIVPVETFVLDKAGQKTKVTIDTDEGPRDGVTVESLSKLRPAFVPQGGSTTAGNASQVSDGAAAVLVCSRRFARAHNLPVMGSFRSFSVVGVPPAIMGVGPAFAIPKALAQANITKDDVDVYEINEAFASQACMSIKHIGIDMNKVNPNGGAIALGHPLGCTGARQVSTLLNELQRSKGKVGVISMCIGSGMGAAAVLENEV